MAGARKSGWKIVRTVGSVGNSKGDFMDYIEKASHDLGLTNDLLAEAYSPGETPEKLLTFFANKNYYGVSLEDCQKLINVVKEGPLPCDFSGGAY